MVGDSLISGLVNSSPMSIHPPDPPAGVQDLHAQPGVETDEGMYMLRDALESGLSEDVFDTLTQYLSTSEVPSEATEEYRQVALEYVQECIAYREEIRPDSLRERDELPEWLGRITVGDWVWYHGGADGREHDRSEDDADTVEHGKYLFFAPEGPRVLENIVLEQFQMRPFGLAKVPTIPGKREDWVLCLYQDDNRYWYTLREAYHNPPRVRFRGFKTNTASRRGEYSERFERSR